MMNSKASLTAMLTAYARAYHATHVKNKIFDDFLAASILTPEEQASMGKHLSHSLSFFDPEVAATGLDEDAALEYVMRTQNCPITLSRERFTEDNLKLEAGKGIQQYVILGAGMDTFAFRNPELLKKMDVFEIDHPSTQEEKKKRIAALGWELPSRLHFVPVDFSKDSLAEKLKGHGFSTEAPSLFSWLGVIYYLPREAVFNTLRSITTVASKGSKIVFDYLDTDAPFPERSSRRVQKMQEIVNAAGEPMKTFMDPVTLARTLEESGLGLMKNLGPAEIEALYFSDRTDGFHAFENIHFAMAEVL